MKNYTDDQIKCWKRDYHTKRGTQERIFLWLQEESYIVILGENNKRNTIELITAYFTENINKFEKECKKYPDPRKKAETAQESDPENPSTSW